MKNIWIMKNLLGTRWVNQQDGTQVTVVEDLEPHLPISSRWIALRTDPCAGYLHHIHVKTLVEEYDRVFDTPRRIP